MLLEEKYELTKSDILEGEIAEFDPVEKPKRERNPMYLASTVDMVIDDVFSDLRDTLKQNEQLSSELNELKGQIDKANVDAQNANESAQIKQEDLVKLTAAEALLSDLEQTMNQFKQKRKEDGEQINLLSESLNARDAKISEMEVDNERLKQRDQERESELEEITQTVNEVLNALEERFAHLMVES